MWEVWFLCLLELSAAAIDPGIRDSLVYGSFQSISLNLANPLPAMLMRRLTVHQSGSSSSSRARGLGSLSAAVAAATAAAAAVPDADACVIDSLHLTSAMSEQRSIQQICARKSTRSSSV